jgi:hypothetical protein
LFSPSVLGSASMPASDHAVRRALRRAEAGRSLSVDEGAALMEARGLDARGAPRGGLIPP